MSGPMFYNGQLLMVDGQVAMDAACCCDDAPCCESLIAFTTLKADVECGMCTETIDLNGSPNSGWTGLSSCESILNITLFCIGDPATGKGRFRMDINMESSAPCEFNDSQERTADCRPLDTTFQFDTSSGGSCCGPLFVRVYFP